MTSPQQYPPGPPQPQQVNVVVQGPRGNLDTNRSLLKIILLGIITLGIYAIYILARSGEDLNAIAGRYDNKRTMNFWLVALILSPITFGIVGIVWQHSTSNRIGNEQQRRGLTKTVSAADYWLWGVLGALIIVGPFIFTHKWLTGMNSISADYNERG